MRIRQIVLEILSRNHLSPVVALMTSGDLEKEVKVTRFELSLRLTLCTKFGEDTLNIF